jgi:hypothetical protein
LNLLGENTDLFSADSEGLLDLIEDYFDDHTTAGKLQPSLLFHPVIISGYYEY